MSKICWFDGSDHHLAGACEEEDSDLETDEIEHRISQLVEEKAKFEARLVARLDDSKWIITGIAPFVAAFQQYPDKKVFKRGNFDSIFKKICMWDDWCLRLDLTIICGILILPKNVHEIRNKQKALNQYFNKHYPKLALAQWAAEKGKKALSKISGDNAVAKKLQQGLFSVQHTIALVLTLPDLESYLLQTPTQTTKPSQDPPSSPPDATNRITLGNLEPGCIDEGRSGLDTISQDQDREVTPNHGSGRIEGGRHGLDTISQDQDREVTPNHGSGRIEGGRNGFDTISQDQDREATLNRDSRRIEGGRNGFDTILQQETEVRRPQTDPSPASSQSLPPLNGFTFPPQSLHPTNPQRSTISTQAMSNLRQSRREFTTDANQQQGGRDWHPGQQFSMNQVQDPNQSLNHPNQPLGTAPAATIDSQPDSNTGLFVNFTQVDKGKATKRGKGQGLGSRGRGKRQKLDNLSQDAALNSNAEQPSASTWQGIPVGQQGQAHIQAQSFNVQASLYSPPFQQGRVMI
jgi:hypothetical protein